ncbi:UvrB/UvrC motif-containing protein [Aceticella autotrophica]|uniref:UvrB/UvrC motif-containing protein n=1 Tax=Aceticella autotrophica TaxID=2755338 RepID=A0A975GAA6_9THEO|nr:UvrB/UvrC motif-containing protein [Aceticella autotrophica]QSZ27188.1 UvrB/UvrC motif-containing protein [Aceticella autotrophica]
MLCDKCKERPATVHYTQIINGVKTEMNLCEQCAAEEGLINNETFASVANFTPFSVQNLLAGLMNFLPEVGNTFVGQQLKCDNCGLTYDMFRQTGRLGCSHCYDALQDELNPLMRRIHGSIEHRGKIPRKTGGIIRARREIDELKEKLEKAVKEEAYEEAAVLRDKIRELEKEFGK